MHKEDDEIGKTKEFFGYVDLAATQRHFSLADFWKFVGAVQVLPLRQSAAEGIDCAHDLRLIREENEVVPMRCPWLMQRTMLP